MDALSSGGLHETGKDAVGFESALGSGSEAYLAEDDQMPERLFCMIVGGGNAGTAEEGKEEFLLGSCEIGSQGLSGFKVKRAFANGVEFFNEACFDLGRRFPRDSAGFELLADFTESRA